MTVGIISLPPQILGAGFGAIAAVGQRQTAGGGVDQDRIVLGVADHDGVGRLLQNGFEQVLLRGEFGFRLFALGQIEGRRDIKFIALIVGRLADREQRFEGRAVLAPGGEFQRAFALSPGRFDDVEGHRRIDAMAVGR